MPQPLVYRKDTLTNVGGILTYDISEYHDEYVIDGSGVLAGSWTVVPSANAEEGYVWNIRYEANWTVGIFNITIFGETLTAVQATQNQTITVRSKGAGVYNVQIRADFDESGQVETDDIADEAVTEAKMTDLVRGSFWLGDATGRPAAFDAKTSTALLVGDGNDLLSLVLDTTNGMVGLSVSGGKIVMEIVADSIDNSHIATNAAIEFSKMEVLTVSQLVVTDGSGVIDTIATLTANLGGTGLDTSGLTGFPVITAGAWAVGGIADVKTRFVSFEANSQGVYYILFPFACTVDFIDVHVGTLIEGTDDGELLIQNNVGANMVGSGLIAGVMTILKTSTTGTQFTSSLTGNNVFAAGERMRITSSKTTNGGTVYCDVTLTRLS